MKEITLTEEELNECLQAVQAVQDTKETIYFGTQEYKSKFIIFPFKFAAFTIIVYRQKDNNLYNFITKEGTFLFDEWFALAMTFKKEGIARALRQNGEVIKIDKQGKIVVSK